MKALFSRFVRNLQNTRVEQLLVSPKHLTNAYDHWTIIDRSYVFWQLLVCKFVYGAILSMFFFVHLSVAGTRERKRSVYKNVHFQNKCNSFGLPGQYTYARRVAADRHTGVKSTLARWDC